MVPNQHCGREHPEGPRTAGQPRRTHAGIHRFLSHPVLQTDCHRSCKNRNFSAKWHVTDYAIDTRLTNSNSGEPAPVVVVRPLKKTGISMTIHIPATGPLPSAR